MFLTAKSQESDKLIGLMAGADDYLVKPFSYAELLARTKALLRRYNVYRGRETDENIDVSENGFICKGEIRINQKHNEVILADENVDVTEIEYKRLLLMIENAGKIFSTKNLYESVWQEPYFYISNNTVMVHIRKLRMKLEKDPKNPKYIHTVWGKGYKFDAIS